MNYDDIRRYLRPYGIVANRKTTINHAFAAAAAPHDEFDEDRVRQAITLLGQDPNLPLTCAYCGVEAETWDHVFATTKKAEFSGHGHRIHNLLPCCKTCNSRKGNKNWKVFMDQMTIKSSEHQNRINMVQSYIDQLLEDDLVALMKHDEYAELIAIRDEVLRLMQKGDEVAARLRHKARESKK